MIKLIWVVILGLGLYLIKAKAEDSVVIDAEMIGEQAISDTQDVAIDIALNAESISQADANRERILKGGKMSARQKNEMAKAAVSDSNKLQGDTFLEQNRTKPGVISLPSGVQYKILRASKGKMANDNSVVVCRYRGELIDGTVFDKSEAGKPAALNVATFLPGLIEAIKLMPSGSKWQVVVPSQLGYGEMGNRGVGANAVLIYEIEIISVK
jgi:FKBP-type peptidyl-prolyl cis-trans isomerase FklB